MSNPRVRRGHVGLHCAKSPGRHSACRCTDSEELRGARRIDFVPKAQDVPLAPPFKAGNVTPEWRPESQRDG